MKIATWNLERPSKISRHNQAIIDCLEKIDADILILTETNEIINFGGKYNNFHTSKLEENYYKEGEKRVSIYSKFNAIQYFKTFRNNTSIWVEHCKMYLSPGRSRTIQLRIRRRQISHIRSG